MDITPGVGLVAQANSGNKYYYKKLTVDILDKCLQDYKSKLISSGNYWHFYVNDIMLIHVDITTLRAIDKTIPPIYYETIHKGKYKLMLSIGSKISLIKGYYNYKDNNFDIKKGSKTLFTVNSFSSNTFKKIKQWM